MFLFFNEFLVRLFVVSDFDYFVSLRSNLLVDLDDVIEISYYKKIVDMNISNSR